MSTCWPARWPFQPGTSSVSVAARGVSGAIAATVAVRQSVALITLLKPGIPAVVISERLPEAGLVLLGEGETADPLGALPEVQMRDQQARRTAVLGFEVISVELVDDPRLATGDVVDRQ